MTNRTRFRARARAGGSGVAYDPDAQAYIDATGELFPDALNTLVLGIKAAGLWDDHIGSIKKAIGVPSLAASMIDLRNTAFNGTAVNTPTHSATEGWGFTAASSQYIDTAWQVPVTGSKASQNSVHYGFRVRAGTVGMVGSSYSNPVWLGILNFENGLQRLRMNDGAHLQSTQNPGPPGHYIGTRRGATERESYKNGASILADSQASLTPSTVNITIAALNVAGTGAQNFFTGRISAFHAGAALSDAQAAALTTLFDAYATVAGET